MTPPVQDDVVGIAIGLAQALVAGRRLVRRFRGTAQRPSIRRSIVVVALCSLWVLLLLMAIPAVVYPLGVMLVNVPDLGWTLLAGASSVVAHASLAPGRPVPPARTRHRPAYISGLSDQSDRSLALIMIRPLADVDQRP